MKYTIDPETFYTMLVATFLVGVCVGALVVVLLYTVFSGYDDAR